MSLILDALNRAENERKNQNAVPDLSSLHLPQEHNTKPGARRTLWAGIAVILALIAIIIALVIVLRRAPIAPPQATNESSQSAAPVGIPVPQEDGEALVVPSPAQNPPADSEIAAEELAIKAPAKNKASNAAVDKLYSTEESEPMAVVEPGVGELYAAEAATMAASPASETIVDPFNPTGAAAVAAAAVEEQGPPRTFDSIANIPDFNALPWNMRQQIPTISYARHDFLVNGVSSVVINNQTTGVGNIIGTGQFVVQEIYVDGVVLKHGNIVFKLRALTGWINM
ncbi:MAG TPA: hypothetical protein VLC79_16995 [Cellvibrio sp.]|nr:hypothetical protein [Cellvibrio sp.]